MVKATHFDKINGARKLDEREFKFHRELGYISLLRKLQNDEVLAVAYEYTFNGKTFKVGELTEDYINIPETEVIFMKMLRPGKINIRDQENKLILKNISQLRCSGPRLWKIVTSLAGFRTSIFKNPEKKL